MKKFIVAIAGLTFILSGCAPSSKALKEAIEKDPSIVFVAIEKDPEKFLEVVNKAAKEAQMKQMGKQQEDENKKRDEEFKNPLKPNIESGRAAWGPSDAKVTIVEYSDFECPYCSKGYRTVQEVKEAYPNQVRLIFKHLPLEFHAKALPAAKYFEAIARQSAEKAYKFHDLLFENQDKLKEKGEAWLAEAAKKVGADVTQVKKDLNDPKLMERITADTEEAKGFQISGTPGFVINGVSLRGAYPFSEFKVIIDRHLQGK